jgi:hypothetical protein
MRLEKPWSRENSTFPPKHEILDEKPNPKRAKREMRADFFKMRDQINKLENKLTNLKKSQINKQHESKPHRVYVPKNDSKDKKDDKKDNVLPHYALKADVGNEEISLIEPLTSTVLPYYVSPKQLGLLRYWFNVTNGSEYHFNSFMLNMLHGIKEKHGSFLDLVSSAGNLMDDIDDGVKILTLKPLVVNVQNDYFKIAKHFNNGQLQYKLTIGDGFMDGIELLCDDYDFSVPYTSYGIQYHYKLLQRYGPFELGQFVLNDDGPKMRRFKSPTMVIFSNVLTENGRKRNFTSWLKRLFVGAKTDYKPVSYEVPLSLYHKLVMCAMMSDDIDDKLLREMKSAASRWRFEPNNCNLVDDFNFHEMLPHVIMAACRQSMPHLFGAKHFHWNNEMIDPLTRYDSNRRYTRVPLPFTYLYDCLSNITGESFQWIYNKVINYFSDKTELFRHESICLDHANSGLNNGLTHMQQLSNVERSKQYVIPEIKFEHKGVEVIIPNFNIPTPKFSSRPIVCTCRSMSVKRYYSHFIVEGVRYFDFCNCASNLVSGLTQRYFRPTLEQNDYAWKRFGTHLLDVVESVRTELKADFDEWLQSRPWPESKKEIFRKARLSTDINRMDFDRSRVFIKSEMGIYIDGVDKFFKPRIIFEKTPYNLGLIGPWMTSVSKYLKTIWDGGDSNVLYACGYDRVQLGAAFERMIKDFPANHFYESDLVMCETSMKGRMTWLESEFYDSMGVDRAVNNVLFGKEYAAGSDRTGVVKYTMAVMKESGTGNTTVGNTLVHTAIVKACLEAKVKEDPTFRYKFLVGSDDALLVTNKSANDVYDNVRRLGLNPEVIHRRKLNKCRFYSGRFIPMLVDDNSTPQLVHCPLIAKTFVKSGTFKDHHLANEDDFATSVILNRRVEYESLPILREVVVWAHNELKPSGRTHKIKSNENLLWKSHNFKLTMCDATVRSICECYNITRMELEELEKRISNTLNSRAGIVIREAALINMLQIDLE